MIDQEQWRVTPEEKRFLSNAGLLEHDSKDMSMQLVTDSWTGGVVDDDENSELPEFEQDDGYNCLRCVYAAAVEQASGGKGRERHASGEPFNEQTIMQTTRSHGIGFATGQAEKKGRESHRLVDLRGVGAAQAELLGAMNYLAAAYLRLEEMKHDMEAA